MLGRGSEGLWHCLGPWGLLPWTWVPPALLGCSCPHRMGRIWVQITRDTWAYSSWCADRADLTGTASWGGCPWDIGGEERPSAQAPGADNGKEGCDPGLFAVRRTAFPVWTRLLAVSVNPHQQGYVSQTPWPAWGLGEGGGGRCLSSCPRVAHTLVCVSVCVCVLPLTSSAPGGSLNLG